MRDTLLDVDPAQPEVCCGTCTHWVYAPEVDGAGCPKQPIALPDDLMSCVCRQWQREPYDSFAVELWRRLRGGA